MDDESSDILGQQTKPVLRGNQNTDSPRVSLTLKLVFGFTVLLALYVVAMRIWHRVLVWRERSYKLATRRRHGIPDSDHRPFNVAYAAVLRARQQEKDAAQKANVTQPVLAGDRRSAQAEQNVRQRFGLQAIAGEAPRALSHSSRLPGAYLAEGTPVRSHPESITPPPVIVGGGRYPSQSRRYESGAPSYLSGLRRVNRKGFESENGYGGQKRGFVEDPAEEQETAKRTKHDDWSIGDEAHGLVWQDQVPPQRGAKRYLFEEDEDEDDILERQFRDKRARKVSLDKVIQTAGGELDMDVDEDEDEILDLPPLQRGKKRDRAEAGSTFGGDDEDSGIELESPDSKPKKRTRKRRTFSKRKSDAGMVNRGQKRDRDSDDEEIDFESGDENLHVLRKKRGKKSILRDEELSEHSTSRSQTSSGSRNRGIGEEWTSNGIRWKVGPNGQRLRQALVRRATQKYNMPEDSQHPDCSVDFEVYVETWLTDEEYRDAKQRHLLAGQDTPQRSDTKFALEVQTQTNGKNLLWSSASVPLESPVSRSPISERSPGANQRLIKTSLTSMSSSRANPFEQIPAHNMRRISSISRASSVGTVGSSSLTDSTNTSPHVRYKTYSKLEKQELEAQALMKLRELKSKKEAESTQAKDDQTFKGTGSFTIPTITVTTPSDTSKQATQPVPLFNIPKPSEADSTPAEMPKPPSSFPFPPSTGANKPSLFPTTSTSAFSSTPSSTASKAADKSTTPTIFPLTTSSGSMLSNIPGTPPVAAGTEGKTQQPAKPSTAFNFRGTTTASNTNMASTVSHPDTTSRPLFSLSTPGILGSIQTTPTATPGTTLHPSAPQPAASGSSLLSRLGPAPASTPSPTIATANPSQSISLFKPSTGATAVPNPFTTKALQPATQPTSSDSSSGAGNQFKFKFNLTGPASTSPSTSTALNVNPASAATSSSPFESKTPSQSSMVTFSPLTPGGGKQSASNFSNTSATGSDPSSFEFKGPISGVNGNASKQPTSIFGATGGTPNPFTVTGSSNMNSVFGGAAFGVKPSENKPAEAVSNSPFNFGVTGGQTSSIKDNPTTPAPTAVFGANAGTSAAAMADPASASSSLFNALGSQPTNTFGSSPIPVTTSAPGPANIFGVTNNPTSRTSAPTNLFGSNIANVGSISAPATAFGAQNTSASSSNQPFGVFGGAGTSSMFGANATKPAEAPKPVFDVASAPAASRPTSMVPTAEQEKPTFRFQLPALSNSGSSNTGTPGTSSTNSGPQFTFNFALKNAPGSNSPHFGATSTGQLAPAAKPSTFNVGSTFGSTGGPSGFNPLGTASQANTSGQK